MKSNKLKSSVASWHKFARFGASIAMMLVAVFTAFAGVSLRSESLVFDVGFIGKDFVGINQAQAATISGLKPTACGGTNAVTGSSYTQPPSQTGNRSYCNGIYTCTGTETQLPSTGVQTGNVNTCINPVTGAQMQPGYQCRVGNLATGYGTLFGRDLPQSVVNCSCQGIEKFGACTTLEKGGRMPGVSTVIVNGCATEYQFDSRGIATAKPRCGQYFDARTGTINYQGVPISNADGSPLGSNGNQNSSGGGSSSGSGTGSGSSGSSTSQTPQSGNVIGWVEAATTTVVEGWALLPSRPDLSVDVRTYLKKQGQTNLTFVSQTTANVARPDINTFLNLPSSVSNRHGFRVVLPSGVANGDTVIVYGVNPSLGWNPSLGEKVVGSADSSAPRSVVGTVTSTNAVASAGTQPFLNGSAPRSWSEWIAFCNANPSQLCLAPTGDGGQNCAVMGKGVTQAEADACRARYEACGGGNRPMTGGFCDPEKYLACKNAGMVDGFGRIDVDACDRALIDAGCATNPQAAAACRPECVLPGASRPSDCPSGSGGDRSVSPPRQPIDRPGTRDCVVGGSGANGCQPPTTGN